MKSYKHFTLKERICIAENLKNNKKISEIAKDLKKDKSSVSREISRNRDKDGKYDPIQADDKYEERRSKCRRRYKLLANKKLRKYVISCLGNYWSPECISGRLKLKSKERISFKTIYNAINKGILPKITAQTHLRRRGKKKYPNRSRFNTIQPTHTIHQRPKSADNKSRFGHFEGDTVLGGVGKGCLVTNVDIKSKYLMAKRSLTKSQLDVGDAMLKCFTEDERLFRLRSITLDNGSEFANFKEVESQLDTTIYFADPHSPWQRGLNENTNGILRFFFPKGYDFRNLSDEDLQKVVFLINSRPRKCLGYLSPIEFLSKKLR